MTRRMAGERGRKTTPGTAAQQDRAEEARALRLPTAREMRLASGLTLFTFALMHLLNHALGVFGVEAMSRAQEWRLWLWRSPPGALLLYGAMATHVTLGLARIVARRSLRMPWLEAAQIALALAIPFWLAPHILGTRVNWSLFGVDDSYFTVLRNLWPSLALQQTTLALLVWAHGCIGLFYALRTRRWFPAWRGAALAGALLVPALALAGFVAAGREAAGLPPRPGLAGFTDESFAQAVVIFVRTHEGLYLAAALLVAVVIGRRLFDLTRTRVAVAYAGGPTVLAAPGATLLEISRRNRVPHASVCGGRARCSTCRVRITAGGEALPPPGPTERAVLERIEAPAQVRLACQIRPTADLAVQLLIPAAQARGDEIADADPFRWGVERRVTVLFADLRGFTALAERQYPYDVVFLLNRFLGEMGKAVVANGGVVDKYLGDGLMALFGTTPQKGAGAEAAIRAARDMLAALERVNGEFEHVLGRELRMGIGVHMGPAILGRIGAASQSGGLTALGDTVNTASRLEAATKEIGASVVISEVTMAASGLQFPDVEVREIQVRGRAEPLVVHALDGFDAPF